MDIKLSRRMQAVADMVQEKRVVDIGCDHAFVSIYLASKPHIERVIAMDVKKGPVDIARANVAAYKLANKIEVRMSDGFGKLEKGEANAAIIAGMGGYLMIDILEAGRMHLKDGISLILQPQSDIKAVREYLTKVGYVISHEDMLIEEGKYYTVIRAVPCGDNIAGYSEEELCYGPILLDRKHPVLKDYLEYISDKNLEIIDKLNSSGSEKSKDRVNQLIKEKENIDNILQQIFNESI